MLLLWSLLTFLSSFALAHANLEQVAAQLNFRLSSGATIILPWNARWQDLQFRASWPRISPAYSLVVQAATESDVQATIVLANQSDIPFLAVSGSHGWSTTIKSFPYGIQINMRRMNATSIDADGRTAHVGGGALQHEVVSSLFTKGKYAVTGVCECTSLAGPLLGGGHSFLQGQYGFALDGLVSARIALANGHVVTASRTQNSNLFWALRGAGHNFGILTSLEVRIYDIKSNWTVYTLIYMADRVEALFELVNNFEEPGSQRPSNLVLSGTFVRIATVDADKSVVVYNVLYEGPLATAEVYAAPFRTLKPIQTTTLTDVPYSELYKVTGNGLKDQACADNQNIVGTGISLPSWNTQDVRAAFNIFANVTAEARFSKSVVLMENYGMQGVREFDPALIALAAEERQLPILASPIFWWQGADEEDVADAYAYIDSIHDALFRSIDGSKRHTYGNYAVGGESKEQLYGYDWRLEKLRRLKREWDPRNKFGYFNSLI